MRKYLSITKCGFMASLIYRMHFIFSFLGNLLFITITYFLWNSIYKNSGGTLNGMSFNQTFAYLALATSISGFIRTWVDWNMSRTVLDGSIVMTLVKPLDYQINMFFDNLGFVFSNLITVTIPSILFVVIVFGVNIHFGINILFFIIALLFTVIICFIIDYITGLIAFYTESMWGIISTKDILIALMSGMIVPLSFYPDAVRQVLMLLPFQAIYNTPLTVLTSNDLGLMDYIGYISAQCFWVVVLILISRVFYSRAIKAITVNGG